MSEHSFRNFEIGDFDAVTALWQAAGLFLGSSDTKPGLLKKLERDPDLFFVMTDSAGQIIGCVMGTYDGRRGWINHLAVSPDRQGEGLGRLMIKELEARFRKTGCQKVNLLIEPTNAAVQTFYQRLDYSEDKLIFMEKWL